MYDAIFYGPDHTHLCVPIKDHSQLFFEQRMTLFPIVHTLNTLFQLCSVVIEHFFPALFVTNRRVH